MEELTINYKQKKSFQLEQICLDRFIFEGEYVKIKHAAMVIASNTTRLMDKAVFVHEGFEITEIMQS